MAKVRDVLIEVFNTTCSKLVINFIFRDGGGGYKPFTKTLISVFSSYGFQIVIFLVIVPLSTYLLVPVPDPVIHF